VVEQGREAEHVEHERLWQQHWLRWDHFEPPLRPQASDIEHMERTLAELPTRRPLRALLLGVTPEIATLRWPAGTQLTAVDRSPGMIRNVWPATAPPNARVLLGDWLSLPLRDGSCDVVLGDGCFSQVSHPAAAQALVSQIRRVLDPSGMLLMRSFVQCAVPESVADLFADLTHGRIGSFHIFKWRLNMALQPSLQQGVQLNDVWEAVHRRYPDLRELVRAQGWSAQAVDTIHAYRNCGARYHYPTIQELQALLVAQFIEQRLWYPSYELGERCPHQCWVVR
jgi:SAM-dependent methyltransferase